MSKVAKFVKRGVVTLVGAYVLVLAYFFFMQQSLLFHPMKGGVGLKYYQEKGELREVKEVTIESSDGIKLQAWYLKPQPGYEMVLYFHGNSGNLEKRAGKLQMLADMGYGFFIPAWRGFGNSEGAPTRDGLFADADAAVEFLRNQGYDSSKTVVLGESLGSGPAIKVARQHEFKGMLLITPYTSIGLRAKEMYPFLPVDSLLQHNFDNISYIQDIHIPILLVHGTQDTIMPHHHSEQLLEKANEPKKLVLYADVGHSDYNVVEVFAEMRKFLGMANNHKKLQFHPEMEDAAAIAASAEAAHNTVEHQESDAHKGNKPDANLSTEPLSTNQTGESVTAHSSGNPNLKQETMKLADKVASGHEQKTSSEAKAGMSVTDKVAESNAQKGDSQGQSLGTLNTEVGVNQATEHNQSKPS